MSVSEGPQGPVSQHLHDGVLNLIELNIQVRSHSHAHVSRFHVANSHCTFVRVTSLLLCNVLFHRSASLEGWSKDTTGQIKLDM